MFRVWRPAGRHGSRSTPREPFVFGFRARTSAGCFEVGGPVAGMVRARLPASPLFLVSGREPRAGFFEISGPTAGMVRAHLSASPLFSVSGREPRAGNFGIRGPPAGCFKARFAPPSSLALAAPFRGANSSHKFRASVQKAPCRFIGKVLPSPQQSPAGPSPAGHF